MEYSAMSPLRGPRRFICVANPLCPASARKGYLRCTNLVDDVDQSINKENDVPSHEASHHVVRHSPLDRSILYSPANQSRKGSVLRKSPVEMPVAEMADFSRSPLERPVAEMASFCRPPLERPVAEIASFSRQPVEGPVHEMASFSRPPLPASTNASQNDQYDQFSSISGYLTVPNCSINSSQLGPSKGISLRRPAPYDPMVFYERRALRRAKTVAPPYVQLTERSASSLIPATPQPANETGQEVFIHHSPKAQERLDALPSPTKLDAMLADSQPGTGLIYLRHWFLVMKHTQSKRPGVYVCGARVKRGTDGHPLSDQYDCHGRLWQSSRITYRFSDRLLYTKDAFYVLVGGIVQSDDLLHSKYSQFAPAFIRDSFKSGFPRDWAKLTATWATDLATARTLETVIEACEEDETGRDDKEVEVTASASSRADLSSPSPPKVSVSNLPTRQRRKRLRTAQSDSDARLQHPPRTRTKKVQNEKPTETVKTRRRSPRKTKATSRSRSRSADSAAVTSATSRTKSPQKTVNKRLRNPPRTSPIREPLRPKVAKPAAKPKTAAPKTSKPVLPPVRTSISPVAGPSGMQKTLVGEMGKKLTKGKQTQKVKNLKVKTKVAGAIEHNKPQAGPVSKRDNAFKPPINMAKRDSFDVTSNKTTDCSQTYRKLYTTTSLATSLTPPTSPTLDQEMVKRRMKTLQRRNSTLHMNAVPDYSIVVAGTAMKKRCKKESSVKVSTKPTTTTTTTTKRAGGPTARQTRRKAKQRMSASAQIEPSILKELTGRQTASRDES